MLHNTNYEIEFAVHCVDVLGGPMEEEVARDAIRLSAGKQQDSQLGSPTGAGSLASHSLSDQWEAHVDPESNAIYYYNVATSESQWEPPT